MLHQRRINEAQRASCNTDRDVGMIQPASPCSFRAQKCYIPQPSSCQDRILSWTASYISNAVRKETKRVNAPALICSGRSPFTFSNKLASQHKIVWGLCSAFIYMHYQSDETSNFQTSGWDLQAKRVKCSPEYNRGKFNSCSIICREQLLWNIIILSTWHAVVILFLQALVASDDWCTLILTHPSRIYGQVNDDPVVMWRCKPHRTPSCNHGTQNKQPRSSATKLGTPFFFFK